MAVNSDIADHLRSEVRNHINKQTLAAGLSELDAADVAVDVLEDLLGEYKMQQEELGED